MSSPVRLGALDSLEKISPSLSLSDGDRGALPVQSQISAGTVTLPLGCASVLAYRPTGNHRPKFQVVLSLILLAILVTSMLGVFNCSFAAYPSQ